MAKTTTSTRTMPRLIFLKTQTMYILGNIVPNFDNNYRRIISDGIDEKMLKKFIVYGKNNQGETELELLLSIDWERHTLEVKKNSEIKLDKNCDDNGVITALKNIAFLFNEEVDKYQLSVELAFILCHGVDGEKLGLVDAPPRKYSSNMTEMGIPLDMIPELGIVLKSKS